MTKRLLTVSVAPHITSDFTTRKIMRDVLVALIPVTVAGIYFFGLDALRVMLVSCVSCVAIEYFIQKYMMKKEPTINDLSAVVTGLLLAFNLPSGLPSWMIVLGAAFAIGVVKMCYGGLGNNMFNPALAARAFLMLSFPAAMNSWPKPLAIDGMTTATPLGLFKESFSNGEPITAIIAKMPPFLDLFLGQKAGCIGEVSIIAVILGFAYLIYRKVITWHVPVIIIGVVGLFTGALWLSNPHQYLPPGFHLLTGGLFLGAVFMATDYTTSPMTLKGAVIFAVGIGVLTVAIRVWGGMPEGISFSILIMNAFVPHINRLIKPYRFGEPAVQGTGIFGHQKKAA